MKHALFDYRMASMGPRPFGRGRGGMRQKAQGYKGCFNGAATFRSRKVAKNEGGTRESKASMGPRPFGRGRHRSSRRPGRRLKSFNGAATFRSRKERTMP